MGNRFGLQRVISVVKYITERGLAFRYDGMLDRLESFSKKLSKLFLSKYWKKKMQWF